MIASVTPIAAATNADVKTSPTRGMKSIDPTLDLIPDAQVSQTLRNVQLQGAPPQKTDTKAIPQVEDAQPQIPVQLEVFRTTWARALEQAESATAQRLINSKGAALPLPEAKPAQPNRTNKNATVVLFEPVKTDPLPLALSFAPAPKIAPPPPVRYNSIAPETASSNMKPATVPQAAPGELAFSANVKPLPAKEAAATSGPATVTKPAPVAPPKPDTRVEPVDAVPQTRTGAASVLPYTPAPRSDAAPAAPKAPSSPEVESVDSISESQPAAPQPMKEIALQLPGTRGLEVRLTERAGEVHVDVRSADAALTQDLRGNLHDLVTGLERKGFSAEVSAGPEHTPAAARSAEAGTSKDQTPDGQTGSGTHQQQRNRQPGEPPEPPNSKERSAAWNAQASASFGKE